MSKIYVSIETKETLFFWLKINGTYRYGNQPTVKHSNKSKICIILTVYNNINGDSN